MFGIGGPEILTLFLAVAVLVLAVLALLMPIYVYQIRNRVHDMNKKMDTIIRLLAKQGEKQKVGGSEGEKVRK